MIYRLRSSGPPSAKPSSVTTDAWVQQRMARSSASLLLARNRPATSVWLPSAGFIAGAGRQPGRRGSEGWEGGGAAETGELRAHLWTRARGDRSLACFQSPWLVRVSPEPSRRAPQSGWSAPCASARAVLVPGARSTRGCWNLAGRAAAMSAERPLLAAPLLCARRCWVVGERNRANLLFFLLRLFSNSKDRQRSLFWLFWLDG